MSSAATVSLAVLMHSVVNRWMIRLLASTDIGGSFEKGGQAAAPMGKRVLCELQRFRRPGPDSALKLFPPETRPRQREGLIEIYRKGKVAEAYRAFKEIYLEISDQLIDHLKSAETTHSSRQVR